MAGRPTDYREEYCQQLIEHMADGYSFESFAGVLGVAKQTLYTWAEVNPEFMDAKKAAFEQSRLFWEKIGIGLASGKNPDGNPTAWIFNMKNRFKDEWRDKQEVEQKTDLNVSGGITVNWPDGD